MLKEEEGQDDKEDEMKKELKEEDEHRIMMITR